jgi:hypothetical protein
VLLVGLVGCAAQDAPVSESTQALLGEPNILLSGNGDFGSVQVGQQSSFRGITASPSGNAAFYANITNITGCAGFVLEWSPGYVAQDCETQCPYANLYECPAQALPSCIPINQEYYEFSVAFRPTLAQTYSCTIQLATDLGPKTFTVTGTGTPPPKQIAVTPSSYAFGDVRVGTGSNPTTINVRNSGGSALNISSVSITSGFAITGGNTGAHSLAVSASENLQVTCNPAETQTGPFSGQLKVTHDAPNSPSTVNLSCVGTTSALDVTPSPVTVTTRVGEPVEKSVTITNMGGASANIQSVALTGDGISPKQLPGQMALGAGAAVNAVFTIDATTPGESTGTLTINYDGQTRSASITATTLATSMALSPDGAYDFGPVCIGQKHSQTITIAADEAGWFDVTGISELPAPFSRSQDDVPLPFRVNGSGANQLALNIDVLPTEVGPAASSLDISSDIPGAPTRSLALMVTGLPAGVSASPTELDLGPADVNHATLGKAIELLNCSDAPVTLSNARLEGELPGEFGFAEEPPDLTVPANGKVRWLLIGQPHDVGTKTATFSVDYPGGTASVELAVNGVSDAPPAGGDDLGGVNTSYYACSTGTAAGAWPLLLALVPILRRRKRARR